MKITSFRGKTAMLSTEIMDKNEQLRNVRPRQGTVPCPIVIPIPTPVDEALSIGYALKGLYQLAKAIGRTIN